MSKKTEAWGWRMVDRSFERRWPHWLRKHFNDIGNYGLRGTIRERVLKGTWFAMRWYVYPRWLRGMVALRRYKRGIPYKSSELVYAERAWCKCGAGLAYWPAGWHNHRPLMLESNGWRCSDVLTGKVPLEKGAVGEHGVAELSGKKVEAAHDYYPFWCYEIRSENQPSRAHDHRDHKVLWGLLGTRYPTCREVGNSSRYIRAKPR